MSQNLLEYFWNHERKNTEDRLRTNTSAIKTMFALLLRSMRDASEWVANYSNITGEKTQKIDNVSYAELMERTKILAETYDLVAQDLNKMLGHAETQSYISCNCAKTVTKDVASINNMRCTDGSTNINTVKNAIKCDIPDAACRNINETLHQDIISDLFPYADEVYATSMSDGLGNKEDIYDDVYDRDLLEMHRHMDRCREEYYEQQKEESDNAKKKYATAKSTLDNNIDVQSTLRKMPINELNAVLEEFYYKSLAKAKESFGSSEVDKQELENLAAKYADELLIEYCMKKK